MLEDGVATKPALLLWQPGRCNVHVWDHLVTALIRRFRVIRMDLRGMGASPPTQRPDSEYTFEQYAADACSVLDHFEIEKTHLWSQSWGTRPAIAFAITYPLRVGSAAFYAANTGTPDVPAQRHGTEEAAKLRAKEGIAEPELEADFIHHWDPQAAAQAQAAMRRFDLENALGSLTMPILIGTGSHDPNLVSSRKIAAQVASAKLVELANVGHNAIIEYPELALSTFLEFHDTLKT